MIQYDEIQKFSVNLLNKKVIISVGSVVALVLIRRAYRKRQQRQRQELKRQSYPRDVVILHQFPRSITLPRYAVSTSSLCYGINSKFINILIAWAHLYWSLRHGWEWPTLNIRLVITFDLWTIISQFL